MNCEKFNLNYKLIFFVLYNINLFNRFIILNEGKQENFKKVTLESKLKNFDNHIWLFYYDWSFIDMNESFKKYI